MEAGDDIRIGGAAVAADGRSRDLEAVDAPLSGGGQRFGLPATARVISCYEAGRDGFWIHRALGARGIENRVVDSASIEVNRRARRAKTDRLDALKLVMMLVRVCSGDGGSGPRSACRRPRPRRRGIGAASAPRWPGADAAAQSDRGLAGDGGAPRDRADAQQAAWWTRRGIGRGRRCRPVQARIARAEARLALVASRSRRSSGAGGDGAAAEPRARSRAGAAERHRRRARRCCSMKAWCGGRSRIGGKLAGCWDSRRPNTTAASPREQGISRAGNKRLQAVMVQLAWGWVRWQRQSALTRWYQERFGGGNARGGSASSPSRASS